jgi:hypothetical protein
MACPSSGYLGDEPDRASNTPLELGRVRHRKGTDDEAVDFSKAQIIAVLELQAGAKTADVCRKHGGNKATFYKWEAKYGGMGCRTRNVARFRPAGLGPRYASKTTPARCSASLVRLARRRADPFCALPGQATPTSRGAVGEDASETALKGVRI